MARRSELVSEMAKALRFDERSLNLCARYLREAGQISQKGRGPSAAHMGPTDATNLLLGAMASEVIMDSPKSVSFARAASLWWDDELPPFACLKEDGRALDLGPALDAIFDANVRFGDLKTDEGLPIMNFSLRVWRPGLSAEIEFDDGDHRYFARYARTHPDLEGLEGEALNEAARKVRADTGMRTMAEIDIEVIWAIGDVLRGYEPKDGEDVKPPYMK